MKTTLALTSSFFVDPATKRKAWGMLAGALLFSLGGSMLQLAISEIQNVFSEALKS